MARSPAARFTRSVRGSRSHAGSDTSGAEPREAGWLEEWTESEELEGAFPHLQDSVVRVVGKLDEEAAWDDFFFEEALGADRDIVPYLQSMANCPLQRLHISSGEGVALNAAAMAQLARCQELQELSISVGFHGGEVAWMDWTDPALFESLTAGSLPCLRSFRLLTAKLSAEAVAAIASSAPQLRVFDVEYCDLRCHPAVVCAMVGGYCEHIEEVSIHFTEGHNWNDVQAADILAAYQSAVAAAGRDDTIKPFTRLLRLKTEMCRCKPP